MTWINLGTIYLTKDWRFTIPVTGEIFRIKHNRIYNPNKEYLKAAIGQGFIDDYTNIFDTRRLTYREEIEIFQFSFPLGLDAHSLFFKRLDNASDIPWIIEVEAFVSTSAEQDFLNYLTQRFGDFMPLFSRQIAEPEYVLQLSDQCGGKVLPANETIKILEARVNRKTIEITNPSNSIVTIGLQVNTENQIIVEQVTLEPRDHYEFPNSGDGAMYVGEVFAHSSNLAPLVVVEKVAIDKSTFNVEDMPPAPLNNG